MVHYAFIHILRCIVRTNIVLDDKLVRQAMKLANVRTMREAVDAALRKFVQSGKQKKVLELKAPALTTTTPVVEKKEVPNGQ